MRNAILVSFLTAVLLTGAVVVQAGPPLNGTWNSTSGAFDEGTATTKSSGNFLAAGNVLYGRSYNGGFTNDWTIQCPTVVSAIPLGAPIGNNGNYQYMITYTGGYLTLGGPGNPWDGGDAVYTGIIDSYVEIRTIQVVSGTVRGWVSDHSVSAHIQGYSESCASWAIGNGVLRGGTSPQAPKPFYTSVLPTVKPANYPDYPGAGCALGPTGPGHWEDIRDLTLTIAGCAVATQQSTWGNVKAMYRD
jgi:hypothetical protein